VSKLTAEKRLIALLLLSHSVKASLSHVERSPLFIKSSETSYCSIIDSSMSERNL